MTYLLTRSLIRVKSRDASASKKQPAEQLNGRTSSAYMKDPNPTSVCRHDVISMWTCNLPPDRHPDKDTTQYPNTLPAEASADSDYLSLSRYLEFFRCSLPKAMSILKSEILRRKSGGGGDRS